MSAASIWPSAWRVAGVFMGVGFLAGTGVEAQTPPDGPLTLQQVLTLLQGGVPAERVRALVVPRCVTFEPSEEAMQSALRAAGASAEFVEALVARCGRPAAAERAAAERALAERAAAERVAAERAAAAADLSSETGFFDFQVETPAAMLPGNEGPRYPEILRAAGIEGEVVTEFVVDTTGRADPATLRIIRSTHAMFEEAVREAVPRVRYLPAEIGGRKVKQQVQQEWTFAIRPPGGAR